MTQTWYPFYWSDYSGKCFHLTQGQHGAYFMLMRFIYTTGKPIPHEQRYSIAKALLEVEQQNTDAVLGQFFERKGDAWVNHTIIEVMQEAEEKHKKRVNAGRQKNKGGIKDGEQSNSNAGAMPDTTTTTPKTTSLKIKPQTPLPVDNVDKSDLGFENDKGGKAKVDSSVYMDISLYLNDKALERAKAASPGWDIYFLMRTYNDGAKARGMPDNPAGAFIAWCGKYTKGKAPG